MCDISGYALTPSAGDGKRIIDEVVARDSVGVSPELTELLDREEEASGPVGWTHITPIRDEDGSVIGHREVAGTPPWLQQL